MSERTKKQLSLALLDLSKTHDIHNISIKDITDYCDLTRVSFYYHFKDKQDLIHYVYTSFRQKLSLDVKKQRYNTYQFIDYMKQYPNFFKQAFQDHEQNNFRDEFISMMQNDYKTILIKQNNDMKEHTLEFLSLFFAYATVDMFEHIINHDTDIEEAVEDFEYAMNIGFQKI